MREKSKPRDDKEEEEEGPEDSPGDVWLSMGYVQDEIGIDDVVTLTKKDYTMGGRALHALPSGSVIGTRRAQAPWGPPPAPPPAASSPGIIGADDARVLSPVIYDIKGNRWRDFGDSIRDMHEEPMSDFPLDGERTALWLLGYIVSHGGTPDARQTKWSTEQTVDKDTTTYQIHDLIGFALELAVNYEPAGRLKPGVHGAARACVPAR